jgi:hypothetical protein
MKILIDGNFAKNENFIVIQIFFLFKKKQQLRQPTINLNA